MRSPTGQAVTPSAAHRGTHIPPLARPTRHSKTQPAPHRFHHRHVFIDNPLKNAGQIRSALLTGRWRPGDRKRDSPRTLAAAADRTLCGHRPCRYVTHLSLDRDRIAHANLRRRNWHNTLRFPTPLGMQARTDGGAGLQVPRLQAPHFIRSLGRSATGPLGDQTPTRPDRTHCAARATPLDDRTCRRPPPSTPPRLSQRRRNSTRLLMLLRRGDRRR